MDVTPDIDSRAFAPVRGRRARRHRESGEIWQSDLLHGDHWEVYKSLKADDHELVVEFTDGTRLLVRGDDRLDISVT